MFPSLTGVIRFLIVAGNDIKIIGKKVSVPYRGYSFFNPTLESPHGYWAQNTFCGAKLFLIGNYRFTLFTPAKNVGFTLLFSFAAENIH